jgi:hypothetical protein
MHELAPRKREDGVSGSVAGKICRPMDAMTIESCGALTYGNICGGSRRTSLRRDLWLAAGSRYLLEFAAKPVY